MPGPLPVELRAMVATEKRAIARLNKAYDDISGELTALKRKPGLTRGEAVTQSQLIETRRAIQTRMAKMWREVGDEVRAGKLEAARGAGGLSSAALSYFSQAGLTSADITLLQRSMAQSAEQGVDAAMKRMMGRSYIPLSTRVYSAEAFTRGKINDVIDESLLRGANAADLARAVRQYIDPSTPGGASYAARRLARTEINNAFHAVSVDTMKKEPFVDYVEWSLSGSHGRPDQCNEYADQSHYNGGEPGVYPNGDVPQRPHPNCLCFVTSVDIGRDEFLSRFASGKMDPWLEEEGFSYEEPEPVLPNLPTPKPIKTPVKPDPALQERERLLQAERDRKARIAQLKRDIANDHKIAAAKAKAEADRIAALEKASGRLPFSKSYRADLPLKPSPNEVAAANKVGSPLTKIKTKAQLEKTRGAPMSHDEARLGANPFNKTYLRKPEIKAKIPPKVRDGANLIRNKAMQDKTLDSPDPWSINCQRVSSTYELRRRGYNVAAAADSGGANRLMNSSWSENPALRSASSQKSARQWMKVDNPTHMDDVWRREPDGARFLVHGPWKQGGAHIWNAEKIDGELYYIEAQTDTTLDGKALRKKYDRDLNWDHRSYQVGIMRVDDLDPEQHMFNMGWITEGA